jgi:hypothetical protein
MTCDKVVHKSGEADIRSPSCPPKTTEMDQVTHNKIVSFIWGIADDVLRDLFKRGKYPDVILPMCVLRRPRKGTFAISGPNGSGKSGVIDAIEFGLTGQIGRLTGRGTKGLSVAEHGPHVDKTKFPDAAFVELKVFEGLSSRDRKIGNDHSKGLVPEEAKDCAR